MKFYIVDVFAERRYSGNQLAVVMAPEGLPTERMQGIAREFNFSETTFTTSETPNNGGYDVRIFTPTAEVPFAGHPTLGTAFIIQREILRNPVGEIALNLRVGQVRVTIDYKGGKLELLTMRQNAPTFGATFDAKEIAPALGIDVSDIDGRFPIEEASTGLPMVMVPLKGIGPLKRIKLDANKYRDIIAKAESKAIMVFSPETYGEENDISVRMFAPHFGIPEDPATGSGCGALAGYLVRHSYFNSDSINIRAEQGVDMGRPSILHLQAEKLVEAISVRVGGRVISVAEGRLED